MKRILIFSDTHGYINDCINLIDNIKPDAVIHAGDYIRDCDDLISIYPDLKFYCVCGNNDFSTRFPINLTVEIDGKRIFITHGHQYCVKYESNYRSLIEKAILEKADLCVFGHTHTSYCDNNGKLIVLNPGSIRFGGTYGICEIYDGKLRANILNYRM